MMDLFIEARERERDREEECRRLETAAAAE
jgi:hypothetical protein